MAFFSPLLPSLSRLLRRRSQFHRVGRRKKVREKNNVRTSIHYIITYIHTFQYSINTYMPQHLPAQNAPRSWLFVPLLLDAAGQLQVAASAMLCSARIGGAGSRSCAARPLSRWTIWMRGPCNGGPTKRLKACGATRLAASRYLWRAPDGYLLAPFQEALMRRLQRRPGLPPHAAADARAARGAQRAKPTRAAPANAVAPPAPPRAGEQRDPLQAMREVDLAHELRRRVYTLQSPPAPMRGALKAALTAGLTEVQRDPSSAEGWKLFLLAPRMLLYRGRGETRVPRAELDKRVALLAAGQCRDLLDAAAEAAAGSDVPGPSRANAADDDAQRRAERAAALAHLGELSAASAALTAKPMAPASLETLAALRDPERRPPTRQVPLPPDFRSCHPRDPLAFNSQGLLRSRPTCWPACA